jgi:hypothetical protein
MEFSNWIAENWEVMMASVLVVIASIDKVAMVALKTLRNIVDAWYDLFPPKDDCECVVEEITEE